MVVGHVLASSQPNMPSPVNSGPRAFAEAGLKPSAGKYVSIYDRFTITGLITWKISAFRDKGQSGELVAHGNLIAGVGRLPFNTDGGGLCYNHPANRGGLTKVVEVTNIVDCDLNALRIGQSVRVVVKATGDDPPVPMFAPAA